MGDRVLCCDKMREVLTLDATLSEGVEYPVVSAESKLQLGFYALGPRYKLGEYDYRFIPIQFCPFCGKAVE